MTADSQCECGGEREYECKDRRVVKYTQKTLLSLEAHYRERFSVPEHQSEKVGNTAGARIKNNKNAESHHG